MYHEENRVHTSEEIPYSYYKCAIPDYFPDVTLHWHKEFEINFIKSGSGSVRLNSEIFSAAPGDIFIFTPESLHAISASPKIAYDTIVFGREMLCASLRERSYTHFLAPLITGGRKFTNPINSQNPYYEEMRTCAENIFSCISCAESTSPESEILLKSELLRLIWLAHSSGCITENTEKLPSGDMRIKSAIAIMQTRFAENMTVADLAKAVNMSPSHFMAKFREAAGIGAVEYLNRLRVRTASDLICAGMPVSEAAYSCGFRNISNFNRQFRKITGCTPGEYINKQ